MKNKIVYLDFDGVINDHNTPTISLKTKFGSENRHIGICPLLVERINKICEATGAVVWVHSSWRDIYDSDTIFNVLADAGLRVPFKGNLQSYTDSEYAVRGIDIRLHIESYGIEKYVILDDMPPQTFEEEDRPYHVRTDHIIGIQDDDVDRAIEILNWS